MLATVLALALSADPVLSVMAFQVQGDARALGLSAASVIEDDLSRVPGLKVRFATDKSPPATHFVLGTVTAVMGSVRIDVRVVDARTKVVKGSTSLTSNHLDERGPMVRAIAAAAGVVLPRDYTTVYTPLETLAAWGKALEKGDAKAIADIAEEFPDFGPAQRRAKK